MSVCESVYRLVRLLVGVGLVVSLAACSVSSNEEEATVLPTVDRTPVPPEVTVCGVVTASRISDVLHQDIARYKYSSNILAPKNSDPVPEYTCDIKPSEGQYGWVHIAYRASSGRLDGSLLKHPSVTKRTTYEDIAAEDSAQPLVLAGVGGEGVTIQDSDGYAGGAAWRYSDGHVLTVGVDAAEDGPRDNPDDVKVAAQLAQELAPVVPGLVAAGRSRGEWVESTGTQYVNGRSVTPTPTRESSPAGTETP